MGLKKQELIDGCFAKAADDEPLFVLRATDKIAPAVVHFWILQAKAAGTPEKKLREAQLLMIEMQKWQIEHGCKVPD
ncbi:MAG TPA: hypothetical protein VEI82_13525 [Myxococcota bacterium]|nr:hypothetical protein [Myxococcota bacterium]